MRVRQVNFAKGVEMTLNVIRGMALYFGGGLVGLGLWELASHGFRHSPIEDLFHELVLIALGLILWCFCAVLTSLFAIDKKLHEANA